MDLDDVGVSQGDRHLGLGDEPALELRIGREVGENPFDRQDFLEAVGAEGLGAEDLGHAADGQPLDQLIAVERLVSLVGAGQGHATRLL